VTRSAENVATMRLPTWIVLSFVVAVIFAGCASRSDAPQRDPEPPRAAVAASRTAPRRSGDSNLVEGSSAATDVAAVTTERPAVASAAPMEHMLHGIVLDARGAPVVGAKVALVWCRLPPEIVSYRADVECNEDIRVVYPHDESETVTDTAGAFAVGYGGERSSTLRVMRGAKPDAIVDGPCDGCVVRLADARQAAEIHVVRADDRTPVLAARVSVHEAEFGAVRGEPFGWGGNATTDADGRCRIDDLPAGPALVIVEADGFAFWCKDPVAIGGDAPIEISLSVGLVVEGRVIDDVTGAAVSGAKVGCSAMTDGAGRFRVKHQLGGRISAWTEGPWQYRTHDSLWGDAPIVVRDGVAEPVEIRLRRPAEVSVRCVGKSGKPIGDAVVYVSSGRAVVSDESGRARCRDADLVRDGDNLGVRVYVGGALLFDREFPPLVPGETRDLGDVVLVAASAAQ
jgi:hypothetical protein